MKRIVYLLPILVLVALVGCKTTEENYRRAYQTATARQNEAFTDDEISLMTAEEAIPRAVYKGDSIPLKGLWVNTVKLDSATTRARRYSVVIGRYRQKFTALSLLNRLRDAGYDSPLLLIDRDQHFYVAPLSTDTLDRAVDTYRALLASPPLPIASPFPYILKRP